MDRVLIDTNVCLDAGLRRKYFAATALEILSRSENKEFNGLIAAHSFDTIFYFLKQKYRRSYAYNVLKGLHKTVKVAKVTQKVIDTAIDLNWKDFEDAIHYQSALLSNCQAIVSRNEKDFSGSKLPVYSPRDFLDKLD